MSLWIDECRFTVVLFLVKEDRERERKGMARKREASKEPADEGLVHLKIPRLWRDC